MIGETVRQILITITFYSFAIHTSLENQEHFIKIITHDNVFEALTCFIVFVNHQKEGVGGEKKTTIPIH